LSPGFAILWIAKERSYPVTVIEAETLRGTNPNADPVVSAEDEDEGRFAKALSAFRSEDVATREAAAMILGGILHQPTVRALVTRLACEPSAAVRALCIDAVRALGWTEALWAVRDALRDSAAAVRLAAVRATYSLAGRAGATDLVGMLHDESEDVRRRAVTCLGWIGYEPGVADVLPLLADESAFVRRAALDALENLDATKAAGQVAQLLDDPEELVCRKALQTLHTVAQGRTASGLPGEGWRSAKSLRQAS
jgi:HEAT repeat protein